MKRKGRHASKKTEEQPENGVEDTETDSVEQEEAPEEKKRKSGRKSGSKNVSPNSKEDKKEKENNSDDQSANDTEDGDEEEYEVDKIINEKMVKGVKHYLIRWKGYEPESDTWEPESTLDCPDIIADYKSNAKKNKSKSKSAKKDKPKRKASKTDDWDENDDFEVDRILEVHFKKDGKREFLVSWKGYPATDNSWEPEENMDCKDIIQKFMSKVDKAKETTSKELRLNRKHTDRFTLSMDSKGRRLSKRGVGKQRVHYHDAE